MGGRSSKQAVIPFSSPPASPSQSHSRLQQTQGQPQASSQVTVAGPGRSTKRGYEPSSTNPPPTLDPHPPRSHSHQSHSHASSSLPHSSSSPVLSRLKRWHVTSNEHRTLICRFCGGKSCSREDYTRQKDEPAIKGLHSSWISGQVIGMQRPSSRLLHQHKIIEQFKRMQIGAIINLQINGEHSLCGDGIHPSGFSYLPEEFTDHGIYYYNFGWIDLGIPSLDRALQVVQVMKFHTDRQQKVAIHCIAHDTLVNRGDGLSRRIQHVMPTHQLLSFSRFGGHQSRFEPGGLTPAACLAQQQTGLRACIEITFSDSSTLRCTPEHQLLVYNPVTKGVYWQCADQIPFESTVVGSVEYTEDVVCPLEQNWQYVINWVDSTGTPRAFRLDCRLPADRERTFAFCRLIGYLNGDGTLSPQGNADLIMGHPIDVGTVNNDLETLFGPAARVVPVQRINNLEGAETYRMALPPDVGRLFLATPGQMSGSRTDRSGAWGLRPIDPITGQPFQNIQAAPWSYPAFLNQPNCPVSVLREFLGGLFGADGHSPWFAAINTTARNVFHHICIRDSIFNQSCLQTVAAVTSLQTLLNNVCNWMARCGVNGCTVRTKEAGIANVRLPPVDQPNSRTRLEICIARQSTDFHRFIGFRHCCHKQMRESLAVRWWRLQSWYGPEELRFYHLVIANKNTYNATFNNAVLNVQDIMQRDGKPNLEGVYSMSDRRCEALRNQINADPNYVPVPDLESSLEQFMNRLGGMFSFQVDFRHPMCYLCRDDNGPLNDCRAAGCQHHVHQACFNSAVGAAVAATVVWAQWRCPACLARINIPEINPASPLFAVNDWHALSMNPAILTDPRITNNPLIIHSTLPALVHAAAPVQPVPPFRAPLAPQECIDRYRDTLQTLRAGIAPPLMPARAVRECYCPRHAPLLHILTNDKKVYGCAVHNDMLPPVYLQLKGRTQATAVTPPIPVYDLTMPIAALTPPAIASLNNEYNNVAINNFIAAPGAQVPRAPASVSRHAGGSQGASCEGRQPVPAPRVPMPIAPAARPPNHLDFASFTANGVVVHNCHAGLGRTGIIIACYFVYTLGLTADQAIKSVRERRPGSIQTRKQQKFVHHFFDYITYLRTIFLGPDVHSKNLQLLLSGSGGVSGPGSLPGGPHSPSSFSQSSQPHSSSTGPNSPTGITIPLPPITPSSSASSAAVQAQYQLHGTPTAVALLTAKTAGDIDIPFAINRYTLGDSLARQRAILQGQERDTFKFVPKLIDLICQRLHITGETSPYFLAACFVDGFRCSVNMEEQKEVERELAKQKSKKKVLESGHRAALSRSMNLSQSEFHSLNAYSHRTSLPGAVQSEDQSNLAPAPAQPFVPAFEAGFTASHIVENKDLDPTPKWGIQHDETLNQIKKRINLGDFSAITTADPRYLAQLLLDFLDDLAVPVLPVLTSASNGGSSANSPVLVPSPSSAFNATPAVHLATINILISLLSTLHEVDALMLSRVYLRVSFSLLHPACQLPENLQVKNWLGNSRFNPYHQLMLQANQNPASQPQFSHFVFNDGLNFSPIDSPFNPLNLSEIGTIRGNSLPTSNYRGLLESFIDFLHGFIHSFPIQYAKYVEENENSAKRIGVKKSEPQWWIDGGNGANASGPATGPGAQPGNTSNSLQLPAISNLQISTGSNSAGKGKPESKSDDSARIVPLPRERSRDKEPIPILSSSTEADSPPAVNLPQLTRSTSSHRPSVTARTRNEQEEPLTVFSSARQNELEQPEEPTENNKFSSGALLMPMQSEPLSPSSVQTVSDNLHMEGEIAQ